MSEYTREQCTKHCIAFILDKLTKNGLQNQTLNPDESPDNSTSSATALSGSQEHCTARGKTKTG